MDHERPLYRIIYDEIIGRIERGEYRKGDRIPTESEWAQMYNVSRITSKRALDMAAENKIIVRYPRKGSFVAIDATKARSFASGNRKMVIGIILPALSDTFGLELFQTLEESFQESGIVTVTGLSRDDIAVESKLIADFLEFGVDGLIIKPVHDETFNNDVLKLIIDGFPVVLIDRYLKDVSCPNVVSNNFQGAVDGMNHLYELGHRNIAVLSRNIGNTTTLLERQNGVMHAIMQSGYRYKPSWMLTTLRETASDNRDAWDANRKTIRSFLEGHPEITAVFGLKYSVLPILEEAAYEIGKRIPDDLSVICFDAPDRLLNSIHQVTHIRQNELEMARNAFNAINMKLHGKKPENRYVVDTEFIPGRTTTPMNTTAPS